MGVGYKRRFYFFGMPRLLVLSTVFCNVQGTEITGDSLLVVRVADSAPAPGYLWAWAAQAQAFSVIP